MADVKFRVGRVQLSQAASGTQDFSIAGFGVPKAAIFFVNSEPLLSPNSAVLSYGFCDATNQACVTSSTEDNTAAGSAYTVLGHSDAAVIQANHADVGLANDLTFSFNAFGTDKVTLNIVQGSTETYFCTYILIGGADVTNTHVGFFDDIGAGTTDITTVGFEPSMVFMMNAHTSTPPPSVAAIDVSPSFGIWINDGLDTQRSMTWYNEHLQNTKDIAGNLNATYINLELLASSAVNTYQLTTPDASGFSIVQGGTTKNRIPHYLCLGFANSPALALFDSVIPTTGDYVQTLPSPGVAADFGMLFQIGDLTAFPASQTRDIGVSIVAFDATNVSTTGYRGNDGLSTSDEAGYSAADLTVLSGNNGNLLAQSSGFSFDTYNGWTFNLSTNPASSVFGWGFTIGVVDIDYFDAAPIGVDNSVSASEWALFEIDTASTTAVAVASAGGSTIGLGEVTVPLPIVNAVINQIDGVVSVPLAVVTGDVIIGSTGNCVAELPTVTGVLVSGGLSTGQVTMPLSVIVADTGHAIAVQSKLPIVSGSAVTGVVATGKVTAKLAQVSGVLVQAPLWVGNVTQPRPTVLGILLSSTTGTGRVENPISIVKGQSEIGSIGTGAVSSPKAELTFTLLSEILMNGEVISALPLVQGFILKNISSFTTWALNTQSAKASNYTQFPFIALGKLGDAPMGVTADGIYLLTGDNDAGQAIESRIQFGKADFRQELFGANDAYIGGDIEGDIEIGILEDGEETEYLYTAFEREKHVRGHHAKFGKGFKSRYRQLSISNINGGDFKINSLTLPPRDTKGNT